MVEKFEHRLFVPTSNDFYNPQSFKVNKREIMVFKTLGTLPPCKTHNTNLPGLFQVQHGDVAERGRDEVRHGEHGQNIRTFPQI